MNQNFGYGQMNTNVNPYSYNWPSYNPYPFNGVQQQNSNDAIIQMIRQYAPYQKSDMFGNRIMFQGSNGEQVIYKPPMSFQNYNGQMQMSFANYYRQMQMSTANYYRQMQISSENYHGQPAPANYERETPTENSEGQNPMVISFEELQPLARSSIQPEIQGYNPYEIPLYKEDVSSAYENTKAIKGLKQSLFKFLDALSPYHFLNSVEGDPFKAMEEGVVNTNEPFKNPSLTREY